MALICKQYSDRMCPVHISDISIMQKIKKEVTMDL